MVGLQNDLGKPIPRSTDDDVLPKWGRTHALEMVKCELFLYYNNTKTVPPLALSATSCAIAAA